MIEENLLRSAMYRIIFFVLLFLSAAAGQAGENGEVSLYFISPADGETVSSPFTVRFGLRGMGVTPAGSDIPKTGHHHLLIDLETLPPLDQPLPKTDHVRHFGGGQTETVLSLPPGEHHLQLLLGNATHTPHDPPVLSARIRVSVSED
jgi:hypothetical protein